MLFRSEANGQGRSDCAPSKTEVAGKTAVELATRTANAGTGQIGGLSLSGWRSTRILGLGQVKL